MPWSRSSESICKSSMYAIVGIGDGRGEGKGVVGRNVGKGVVGRNVGCDVVGECVGECVGEYM